MITEQSEALNHRTGFIFRGGDDRCVQLGRIDIYSEKVARNFAARCQHDHPAGMRVLIRFRIVGEMKSGFARDFGDRRFIADQEMPAAIGSGSAVGLGILNLFRGGERGSFARIDAKIDNVKIFADG